MRKGSKKETKHGIEKKRKDKYEYMACWGINLDDATIFCALLLACLFIWLPSPSSFPLIETKSNHKANTFSHYYMIHICTYAHTAQFVYIFARITIVLVRISYMANEIDKMANIYLLDLCDDSGVMPILWSHYRRFS